MEWIYAIAALASSLAAALAWAAKLWWGKEHIAAKNETIKAKEAQIETLKSEIEGLRQLTPMKIREYFLSVKEQLTEYNDALKSQLNEAKQEINRKGNEIEMLRAKGDEQSSESKKLESERNQIEEKASKLENQFRELQNKYEGMDVITLPIPKIDPNVFEHIMMSSLELNKVLEHEIYRGIPELSKSLERYFREMTSNEYSNPFAEFIKQVIGDNKKPNSDNKKDAT